MPLPHFLDRISSHKKTSKSTPSREGSSDSQEPASHSTSDNQARGLPTPQTAGPLDSSGYSGGADSTSTWTTSPSLPLPHLRDGPNREPEPLPTPSLSPAGQANSTPISPDLLATWDVLQTTPAASSKAEQLLDQIEDTADAAQAKGSSLSAAVQPVMDVLNTTGVMETIEEGLHGFAEGIPIFMKALDEVSDLHPFIKAVVLVFKAVYTLEMTRRENDKKIIALYVEMKEMMGVLLQLKDVQDAKSVAPDGSSIEGRMQLLTKSTEEQIKSCANACDTYSKKKLIVKVIKGPLWNGRLLSYAGTFTKRRSEFEFALSIHTAVGVDTANLKLDAINEKMLVMMAAFQKFMTPEQQDVALAVEKRGGVKALDDSDKLNEFLKEKPAAGESESRGVVQARKVAKAPTVEDVKNELAEAIEAAEEKNMESYSRKFDMRTRQIKEEMERVIIRESDRVISAVTSGPHDRLLDEEIHGIWKDMGWRGNVKARHFVLVLRDHYHEKMEARATDLRTGMASAADSEDWALAYINMPYLQPILEAFDDDASGFITVTEVNRFTTSRPSDWSLPRWIAYWAVGWNMAMRNQQSKINELFDRMFSLLPKVLPANRAYAEEYLARVWKTVYTIVTSLDTARIAPESVNSRFKTYVDAEDTRLQANLMDIHYVIDEMDTLNLVTGLGRIEKYFFPLIRLLLERHLDIFRLCRTRIIHEDELQDAASTMEAVINAVSYRYADLKTIFSHQQMDLKQQFKSFAFGFFDKYHDMSQIWSTAKVRQMAFSEDVAEDDSGADAIDPDTVLNHPLQEPQAVDYPPYVEVEASILLPSAEPSSLGSDSLYGLWSLLVYDSDGAEAAWGLETITIPADASEGDKHEFNIPSEDSRGVSTVVSGSWSNTESKLLVEFTIGYTHSWGGTFSGQLDPDTGSVRGTWKWESEILLADYLSESERLSFGTKEFVLKRASQRILTSIPSLASFKENRARALWTYALTAVRNQVRRRLWLWSFFRDRRDQRRRYLHLAIRTFEYGRPLDEEERAEFGRLRHSLIAHDARYYQSLIRCQMETTTKHKYSCDSCQADIGGARVTCIDCDSSEEWFNTVDFCGDLRCMEGTVTCEARQDLATPHIPTHTLVKVRRMLQMRHYGNVYRAARSAVQRAMATYRDVAELEKEADPSSAKKRTSRIVKQSLSCMACKERISMPCWYCVCCPDDPYICQNCDENGTVSFGEHDETHALVRCQETAEDVKAASTEQRLATVEESLQSMHGRQSRVEDLLKVILAKLSQDGEVSSSAATYDVNSSLLKI